MKRIIAKLTNVRHSPYKMRVVANQAKSMPLPQMRDYLSRSPKRAAQYILKVVNSAVANAENNFSIREQDLKIAEIQIGDARVVRKPKYRARGRMDIQRTRYSHVRVVLESTVEEEIPAADVSEQEIKATKTESVDTSQEKKVSPKKKPSSSKKPTKKKETKTKKDQKTDSKQKK